MSIPTTRQRPPHWLQEMVQSEPSLEPLSVFFDSHHFQDSVHGQIYLSRLECDVIDTPEFQRLFRVHQLGFVSYAYRTANHTRGTHSIGACAIAKTLARHVNDNTERTDRERRTYGWDQASSDNVPQVSFSSSVLISLGALLHDIPHPPFSHDIEKKKHVLLPQETKVESYYGPYPKHDDYGRNAAFYVMIMDARASVLARVLRAYSPAFWRLLQIEAARHEGQELAAFVEAAADPTRWEDDNVASSILPALLFHLLSVEKPTDAQSGVLTIKKTFVEGPPDSWGLGRDKYRKKLHDAWYKPYRHDIIGNTVSADLLDYLMRDMHGLGIDRAADLYFLNKYVLVSEKPESGLARVRCAIDINDYKRGTIRLDAVNEVFRLLDLRFEIHEKAVLHRVVQSTTAMLSRCLLQLGDKKPKLHELYGWRDEGSPSANDCIAIKGVDDVFLSGLVDAPAGIHADCAAEAAKIAKKVSERRVYRPLMVIPGDRVPALFNGLPNSPKLEYQLRELAAIVDSSYYAPFFSTMAWCVQSLLDHAFLSLSETDASTTVTSPTSVRGYLQNRRRGGSLGVDDASRFVATRVIFHALPYKQLYKDPAIVVRVSERGNGRVRDLVHPLHEMAIDGLAGTGPGIASLISRIEAGIRDADSKYEGLWRLFVFVSDGLFYPNLLARIQRLPCATNEGDPFPAHESCVREGQRLVVAALRACWKHWKIHEAEINLEALPTDGAFGLLIDEFVNSGAIDMDRATASKLEETVSAVDVREYLHEDPGADDLVTVPRQCRDVRYKYSESAGPSAAQIATTANVPLDQANRLLILLTKQLDVRLNEGELEYAARRLLPAVANPQSQLLSAAGANRESIEGHLERYAGVYRALWRGDADWQTYCLDEPGAL